MSRVSISKSKVRPAARNASLERHTQRFLELRRGLEQIEYFCKGTVLKRMMKCGKPQCACASDATKRQQVPVAGADLSLLQGYRRTVAI